MPPEPELKVGDRVRVTRRLINMVSRGGTGHYMEVHPLAGKTGVVIELIGKKEVDRMHALVKPRAMIAMAGGQELAGQVAVVSLEYLEPLDAGPGGNGENDHDPANGD